MESFDVAETPDACEVAAVALDWEQQEAWAVADGTAAAGLQVMSEVALGQERQGL